MNSWLRLMLICLSSMLLFSCGGKKTDAKEPTEEAASEQTTKEEEEKVEKAKIGIKDWLGQELTARISTVGKELGKGIAADLASDQAVMEKAKWLTDEIFKDPQVKKQVDDIADRATSGFANQLTLGWKALTSGGKEEYRKKVKDDAKRVAMVAIMDHLRDNTLKDVRMGKLLKDFSPVLKIQSQVAAYGLQENLSPKVTKKILALALQISSGTDKAGMAAKMERWADACDDIAQNQTEKMLRSVAGLQSMRNAIRDLAVEVLGHERTKTELVVMTQNLLDDSEVHQSLVKVYNAAAFDKGDSQIRAALDETLRIGRVDEELFAAMGRLAAAEGAGPIISKHIGKAAEDTKFADIVENFTLTVLESCGEPLK